MNKAMRQVKKGMAAFLAALMMAASGPVVFAREYGESRVVEVGELRLEQKGFIGRLPMPAAFRAERHPAEVLADWAEKFGADKASEVQLTVILAEPTLVPYRGGDGFYERIRAFSVSSMHEDTLVPMEERASFGIRIAADHFMNGTDTVELHENAWGDQLAIDVQPGFFMFADGMIPLLTRKDFNTLLKMSPTNDSGGKWFGDYSGYGEESDAANNFYKENASFHTLAMAMLLLTPAMADTFLEKGYFAFDKYGWLVDWASEDFDHEMPFPGLSELILAAKEGRAPVGQTPAPQPPTQSNAIAVTVNGTAVNFTGQQPTLIDGHTLVPVRGVFEALGFSASWDAATQQITLSRAGDTIVLTLGRTAFTTNGASHTLDVPAQSIGGSAMLPIRAVLESVGCGLEWNNDTRTVVITAQGRK